MEGVKGWKGGGEHRDAVGGESRSVEGEGGMNSMGERGRLGSMPSGWCVNLGDAAIFQHSALPLDNVKGSINRPLICEREG